MKNNEKLEKKYYLDMDKQFQIKDVYCINKKKNHNIAIYPQYRRILMYVSKVHHVPIYTVHGDCHM